MWKNKLLTNCLPKEEQAFGINIKEDEDIIYLCHDQLNDSTVINFYGSKVTIEQVQKDAHQYYCEKVFEFSAYGSH